jgi:hypothetical protein
MINMPTQEIRREKWEEFLAGFSAHNQKRAVNIDSESLILGPQRIVNKRPLLAVDPDLKDEGEPTIIVVTGDPEGGEPAALTHEVMYARAIWVKEDDQGNTQALDIETDDGRTIIEFAA